MPDRPARPGPAGRPAWRGSGCRTARPPRARRALCMSAGRAGPFPSAGGAARFGRRVGPRRFPSAGRGARLRPAGRGARFPSAGRGARLRPAAARPLRGSCGPPAVLAATGSTWPRLRNVFPLRAGSPYASAGMQTPPSRSSLPPKPVPCLDGAEPPLMLIHWALTSGEDRDDACSSAGTGPGGPGWARTAGRPGPGPNGTQLVAQLSSAAGFAERHAVPPRSVRLATSLRTGRNSGIGGSQNRARTEIGPYRQDLRGSVARSSLSRTGGNLP